MQTKADPPVQLLADHKVTPFIRAYFEFNQLKQLNRQGWLRKGVSSARCETVAEHTFSMALLAMMLTDSYFPQLDALRVLRLVLLHDIGEVHAGDFTPSDQVDANEKHRLERDSVQQVMAGLPNAAEYMTMWQEYEDGSTPEARFVKQIDRLEMGLQAGVYQKQGIVDGSEFIRTAEDALSSPQLVALLHEVVTLLEES